jgi:prolyl oligopeptidase
MNPATKTLWSCSRATTASPASSRKLRQSLATVGLLVCTLLTVCPYLGAQAAATGSCPPPTPKDDVVEELHGVRIADPYRWLEDRTAPATRAWIAAQDACTRRALDAIPGREQLRRRLGELLRVEVVSLPLVRGRRLFYLRRAPDQDLSLLYMTSLPSGGERVLVDPRPLSSDHSISLALLNVSADGRYVLYGLRHGGQDELTLRILDVETGQHLEDRFPPQRYSGVTLTADGKHLIYATNTPAGPRVFLHTMGTPAETDRLLFGQGYDRHYLISAHAEPGESQLLLSLSEGTSGPVNLYRIALDRPEQVQPVVTGIAARFSGHLIGNILFVETDWKAPNRRILALDLAQKTPQWRTVIPESRFPIVTFWTVGGRLVVDYLENATHRLRVFTPAGRPAGEVPLPTSGTVSGLEGLWTDSHIWFSFQSFPIPPSLYRYSLNTGHLELWHRPNIPLDAAAFELRQVWYRSADGTRVPMFLFSKKGLPADGNRPVLLTGYGGFALSQTPVFREEAIVWAEQGGLWALANLRGGAEFGEAWHRAGMLGQKQHVFDDFLAAAQWLIQNHYTRPERLAIQGASNGGLLVGAALTQQPELFAAVVCMYPLLDMLRYHLFLGGPWWVSEYGSAENPGQFRWLLEYSPYQNVRDGVRYPAVLLVSGDNDTRVAPLHALKMTARLQAATASGRPILLLYDTRSGHSGGRPVGDQIQELTDILSFLLQQTGALPQAAPVTTGSHAMAAQGVVR